MRQARKREEERVGNRERMGRRMSEKEGEERERGWEEDRGKEVEKKEREQEVVNREMKRWINAAKEGRREGEKERWKETWEKCRRGRQRRQKEVSLSAKGSGSKRN